jgi:hypothetical protein
LAQHIRNEISRIISNTAFQTYEKRLPKEVRESQIPSHKAIIMDGNRSFTKEFGLQPTVRKRGGFNSSVIEWDQLTKPFSFSSFPLPHLPSEPSEVSGPPRTRIRIFQVDS